MGLTLIKILKMIEILLGSLEIRGRLEKRPVRGLRMETIRKPPFLLFPKPLGFRNINKACGISTSGFSSFFLPYRVALNLSFSLSYLDFLPSLI